MRNSTEPTHYETLGIARTATADEIKQAYRKKALELHPDKNPNGEAQFKQLNAAYSVLSDAAQRREYDASFSQKMNRQSNFGSGSQTYSERSAQTNYPSKASTFDFKQYQRNAEEINKAAKEAYDKSSAAGPWRNFQNNPEQFTNFRGAQRTQNHNTTGNAKTFYEKEYKEQEESLKFIENLKILNKYLDSMMDDLTQLMEETDLTWLNSPPIKEEDKQTLITTLNVPIKLIYDKKYMQTNFNLAADPQAKKLIDHMKKLITYMEKLITYMEKLRLNLPTDSSLEEPKEQLSNIIEKINEIIKSSEPTEPTPPITRETSSPAAAPTPTARVTPKKSAVTTPARVAADRGAAATGANAPASASAGAPTTTAPTDHTKHGNNLHRLLQVDSGDHLAQINKIISEEVIARAQIESIMKTEQDKITSAMNNERPKAIIAIPNSPDNPRIDITTTSPATDMVSEEPQNNLEEIPQFTESSKEINRFTKMLKKLANLTSCFRWRPRTNSSKPPTRQDKYLEQDTQNSPKSSRQNPNGKPH